MLNVDGSIMCSELMNNLWYLNMESGHKTLSQKPKMGIYHLNDICDTFLPFKTRIPS